MSASPTARQALNVLPMQTKRIVITDPIQMPEVYSSTPGGTLYSTTPGGEALSSTFIFNFPQKETISLSIVSIVFFSFIDNFCAEIVGTKLIYDRAYLKELRNSPLSQSPPTANIPACLLRGTPRTPFRKCVPTPAAHDLIKNTQTLKIDEQEQFQLEL